MIEHDSRSASNFLRRMADFEVVTASLWSLIVVVQGITALHYFHAYLSFDQGALQKNYEIELSVKEVLLQQVDGMLYSAIALSVAALWNFYAAYTRTAMATRIRERDSSVPKSYESIRHILRFLWLNIILTAGIGVVFAIIDLYVRDQILTNRHVFEGGAVPPPVENRSKIGLLQRLQDLHQKGILNPAEYEAEKQKILSAI